MKKSNLSMASLVIASLAFAPAAFAQDNHAHPAGSGKAGEQKATHEADKKGMNEAKGEVKEAKKDLKDALKTGDAGAVAQATDDLEKAKADLKASRDARRTAHIDMMRAKLGPNADKPGVKEELKKHNSRMARLHTMERLAVAAKKEEVLKRVRTALEKEQGRSDKAIEAIKNGGAK